MRHDSKKPAYQMFMLILDTKFW